MLPTPQEGLASLGAFIRAARLARGINQARAAREAKVSRQQLVLLEKGGNVSVQFLLKVARYLELTSIPLDGSMQLVSGDGGLRVGELTDTIDVLFLFLEHAREVVVEAVLPPSERKTLRNTPALREFVARHRDDADGAERLAMALHQLSKGVTPESHLTRQDEIAPHRAARRTRKRTE